MITEEFKNIITLENMLKALKDTCANVRWKESVVNYEANALINSKRLMDDLLTGRYKPTKYRYMTVYEPKKRLICCTSIRDRQAQHCICDNYLYDTITKSFIYDNFACQVGKGNHRTVKRMTQHLAKYYNENGRSNAGYVLKCDVKKFFNSIRPEIAKAAVRKRVDCPEVVDFVDVTIDGFHGKMCAGGQIIQLVALAVLDDMDHLIKEKLHIKHYMRYMDDFVLIHEDKEYLKYCKKIIEEHLNGIGLQFNEEKTQIISLSKGFTMLHWNFLLKESGRVVRKMDKGKLKQKRRVLSKMIEKEKLGLTSKEKTDDILRSFKDYTEMGDAYLHYRDIKRFVETKRGATA